MHTHTYVRRVCRGHTNQINELAQLEASSNRGEDKERGRLLTSRVLNMEYACQNTNNKEGERERVRGVEWERERRAAHARKREGANESQSKCRRREKQSSLFY